LKVPFFLSFSLFSCDLSLSRNAHF
jgi:hypothetical protein